MIARVASCGLLAACAHAAIERAPQGVVPPAAEVLAATHAAYRHAGSYRDTGDIYARDRQSYVHAVFQTASTGEGRVRIEVHGDRMRGAAIEVTPSSGERFERANLDDNGFADTYGDGIWEMVPRLLRGEPSLVDELDELRNEGVERVDGIPCWKISGVFRYGERANVWIDRERFVMRKYVSPAMRVQLRPELDPAVSPQEVASIQRPVYTTIGLDFDDAGHITGIVPDGPAFAADLVLGDTIVSLDGERITAARCRKLIETAPPGTSFAIVVRRDGELQPIQRVVSKVDDQRDAGDLSLLVDRPLPDLRLATFMDAPPLPTTGTVRLIAYPYPGDSDVLGELLALTHAHAAEGLHLVAVVPNGEGVGVPTDPALEIGFEVIPLGRRSTFTYTNGEIVLVVDRDGIVRHYEWGRRDTTERDVENAVLKALAQPAKPSNLPP